MDAQHSSAADRERPSMDADPVAEEGARSLDTGSAWWVDLSLGALCWFPIAVFALVQTSIGPFADYTLVYHPAMSVAYAAVALGLGAQFVRSGLRKSPRTGPMGSGTVDDATGDATAVGSMERNS